MIVLRQQSFLCEIYLNVLFKFYILHIQATNRLWGDNTRDNPWLPVHLASMFNVTVTSGGVHGRNGTTLYDRGRDVAALANKQFPYDSNNVAEMDAALRNLKIIRLHVQWTRGCWLKAATASSTMSLRGLTSASAPAYLWWLTKTRSDYHLIGVTGQTFYATGTAASRSSYLERMLTGSQWIKSVVVAAAPVAALSPNRNSNLLVGSRLDAMDVAKVKSWRRSWTLWKGKDLNFTWKGHCIL